VPGVRFAEGDVKGLALSRRCEERSDEAIQRRAQARQKHAAELAANAAFAFLSAPTGARWIASLRSQ
jgi:hypothetical protein